MSDEDRYIPGVPCWVDTTQPEPEAAVAFYGGLFGWNFEDVMPPGAERPYFVGRLPGGDVAAVGTGPPGAPPRAVWNTYVWRAGRLAPAGPVRPGAPPRAVWNRSVWVPDVHETAGKVREAGVAVIGEP